MANLLGAEFTTAGAMRNLVEGQVRGPGFHSNVYNTQWQEAGTGIFSSAFFFVEMFLGSASIVGATYDPPASSADYRPLGDVTFLTGDAPLYCKWQKGRQRSVSCTLDIAQIGERWELDWTWPRFDPALSLSAGSDNVRMTLRQIAGEVLAPGFASAARIEAALVAVLIDLRRHVEAARPDSGRDGGTLSARHLALIRAMLLEMSGPGPSVPELARACGMSGRALAASYKRSTGATLRAFMSETRLERARLLLGSSSAPIKQIAYDSGFASASAFVAAFRRAVGVTPAAWRDLGGSVSLC